MIKCQWYYWNKNPKKKQVKAIFKDSTGEYIVDKIICKVPCNSKTKKTNPVFIMEAKANHIEISTYKGKDSLKKFIVTIT